jgi:tetratricopeptide (TPR) repeat protein
MRNLIIVLLSGFILSCIASAGWAQGNNLLAEGNRLYQQKKYKEAMDAYMDALKKNPSSIPGMFNLSNTLYQLGQADKARSLLENTIKSSKDSNTTANANYNIGNTFMNQRNWDSAIEAYKKALRLNPQDTNAKYNLSYAQAMKQKDNQDKKNDKKDKKDNKEDKNKEDKNKADKNNKDQQDKEQKQEPQPGKLSEQQADQILNTLQQDEKNLRDKKQKAQGVPARLEKDW